MSREEGNNYAKQRSALFIETSAKTKEGVAIAFEELLMKVVQTPGLLNTGSSGIHLHEGQSLTSPCNWASSILSSVWNAFSRSD